MQVSLLNQEIIVDKIQMAVESKLRSSDEAKIFHEQVHLKLGSEAQYLNFSYRSRIF